MTPWQRIRHGTPSAAAPGILRRCVPLLALCTVLGGPAAWAQSGSIVISRNLFFEQSDRPTRTLAGSGELPLGPERMEVGGATRLRINSPARTVSAALRFRPLPEQPDAWQLTVVLTTALHDRDFYYLSQGQRAEQGKLLAQADYHADGLETDLSATDGQGHSRTVKEIVLQDDGQAEVRVGLDGDTLRVQVIPPEFGGSPNPPRFAGGKGPGLRFLDYRALGGGYTDNGFGEWWLFNFLVLRGNFFTNSTETRSIGRVAVAQQAWRWERFSLWAEGGAAISQRRDEKTKVTQDARIGLTAGLTGHWRYDTFGASLHMGSAGGPLLTQLLAGWQFSRSWGALLSWQQVKDSSGFGLGLSMNY